MTSEVMLLNMQGGALAADSALTAIEYHENGSASIRYQTGTEKIFVLDDKLPVASMIFDVAEFYRYPWATVFDAFVHRHPNSGNTVPKVAAALVKFLAGWTGGDDQAAREALPIDDVQERLSFAIYIAALVQRYAQCAELAGAEEGTAPTLPQLNRALDMMRFETQYAGDYFQNVFMPFGEQPTRRPVIAQSSQRLVKILDAYLERLMNGMVRAMFGEGVVPPEVKQALSELAISSCVTDWIPPGVPKTGIVFAGYSTNELRPMFLELRVASAFAGIVKHQLVSSGAPGPNEPAIIRSFAQADLIDALLRGAQPGYKYVMFQLMRQGIGALMNAVGAEIAKKDGALARSVLQTFDQAPMAIARAILVTGDDIARHAVEMRVADVVGSAGPPLLAEYAAKLVRLSVIEHELVGSQSVGEPIMAVHMKRGSIERVTKKIG